MLSPGIPRFFWWLLGLRGPRAHSPWLPRAIPLRSSIKQSVFYDYLSGKFWGFPGGWEVKVSASMQETWVRSLGLEDPLEKEMAIHSNTIAWKIPWTEEPGRLQSMGSRRVGYDWATSFSLSLYHIFIVIYDFLHKFPWSNSFSYGQTTGFVSL